MDWFVILVSIGVGLAIIGLWTMLIVRRQVPELQAGLPSIRFHIAAEVGTGLALVAGGVALAVGTPWAEGLAAAGLGATVYSTVNSPGYYADRSEWSTVGMFAGLGLLVLAALVALVWGLRS
jgi:hypothetical protein